MINNFKKRVNNLKNIKNYVLELRKYKISLIGVFGLKFKIFKYYTFNLKNIGKVKLYQEDYFNGWLSAYRCIISSDEDNKIEILKSLFSQKTTI
ncbi:MAG: hypothetical protein LBD03_09460 [Methanobrevibacter sp.]|jgi:hypothetical protein|nr:hypothetical protein [Candidatus Methanovirga procula]